MAGVALLFAAFWLALFFATVGAILLFVAWIRSLLWRRTICKTGRRSDVIDIVIDEDDIRVEPYDEP